MRIVSTLAFGLVLSAIALPAFALDRERLASEAPMEPCPAQGPGFAKIPGTATCIRVSGRVAAGMDVGGAHRAAVPPNAARLQLDTRSPSELGEVRGVVRMGVGR